MNRNSFSTAAQLDPITKPERGHSCLLLLFALACCLCPTANAYPPGPYTIIFGTVRDQYGTPLSSATAQVVLQTPSGLQAAAPIVPGVATAGVSYVLKVPLDSGVTPDLYQPNVLVP